MTKFIHMSIVLQSSWDSRFPLSDSVKEELFFWKENVRCLNGRPIGRHFSCSRSIVYSDASDLGVGGVVKTTRVLFVIFRGLLMKCFAAPRGVSLRQSILVSLVFP